MTEQIKELYELLTEIAKDYKLGIETFNGEYYYNAELYEKILQALTKVNSYEQS